MEQKMNSENNRNSGISNPFVFSKKTPFMQRIADLVRHGHTQYVLGIVPIEKAGFLAYKFEFQFHTTISRVAACRSRKRGEASARLLLLNQGEEKHLIWILLLKPGKTADQSGQKWRDALEDKIIITGYELVRRTRPGSNKPAWSWRYTESQYETLRNGLIQAIRSKHDDVLRQLIYSIARSPGFAGVREQVKKFYALVRQEWKRRRGKSEQCPELPQHGYTRRVEDRGCRLVELRKTPAQPMVLPAVSGDFSPQSDFRK
jgi:hypothetical protein